MRTQLIVAVTAMLLMGTSVMAEARDVDVPAVVDLKEIGSVLVPEEMEVSSHQHDAAQNPSPNPVKEHPERLSVPGGGGIEGPIRLSPKTPRVIRRPGLQHHSGAASGLLMFLQLMRNGIQPY